MWKVRRIGAYVVVPQELMEEAELTVVGCGKCGGGCGYGEEKDGNYGWG